MKSVEMCTHANVEAVFLYLPSRFHMRRNAARRNGVVAASTLWEGECV
jgi:hypothetical protein